ncbi:MAG: ABC transporter permease [Oscillospiraceae bacterium]|nr:ABC transporter permease [Oscillospiraceae bacterium]
MINSMQIALIKKDIRSVTENRNLFIGLLSLPIVMAVVLPSIFMLVVGFIPVDSADFQKLLVILPGGMLGSDLRKSLLQLLINNMVPIFFLLIPVLTAMIMAASSFVGEKEKQTLETLLYCPLSLQQIFIAKVFASFVFSQIVSLVSFVAMTLVVQTEIWFITGSLMLLGLNWLVLLILVSPAISLVAITLIVRGSAKAKSVEESQQRSAFLILPIVVLAVGQFSGVVLVNVWLLLGIGVLCSILGLILLRRSSASFHYERLLQ